MTTNIFMFDFNGVKVIKDANTKLIRLFTPAITVNQSWHNTEDGAGYQVPASRKFTIIFLEDYDPTALTVLADTDDEDSATGANNQIETTTTAPLTNVLFIGSEVAATRWITTTAAAMSTVGVIWGVEETA